MLTPTHLMLLDGVEYHVLWMSSSPSGCSMTRWWSGVASVTSTPPWIDMRDRTSPH